MTNKKKNFWRYQFPAVLWALMIFIASSIPGNYLPKSVLFSYDKLIHAGVFFLFCLLVNRALIFQDRFTFLSKHHFMISLSVVILYGLFDEFHQGFVPGRTSDIFDALADAVGGMIYIVTYLFYRNIFSQNHKMLKVLKEMIRF